MPDSDVVRMVQEQKRKLLEKEAQEMRVMARRWLEVEKALEAEMLKAAIELGGEGLVTEAMILRSTRFQNLMYQARAEFAKYADFFDEKVSSLQGENTRLGLENAYKVLQTAMAEAGVSIAFDKLNVGAVDIAIGITADGSPLRSLLMKSYGEAVSGVLNELVTGLAKGLNPNVIARNMADGFGIGLDRALTIARTEIMRSYRMGSLEQYKNSGVVTQYKRIATKDERTCIGCLFADGQIFDTAEEFSEHPNGRCQIVPVVMGAEPTWETGLEWFGKQSADKQLAILGQERFDAWQSGSALEEMSKHVNDAVWGGSFVPRPVSEITGGG